MTNKTRTTKVKHDHLLTHSWIDFLLRKLFKTSIFSYLKASNMYIYANRIDIIYIFLLSLTYKSIYNMRTMYENK